MNQGKLKVVKQEMARVNIDILGIRMISVSFQGKPFNIIVIQVYVPTTNAEEAETEWFYGYIEDLLELTTKTKCPLHHRGLE